MPPRSAKKGVTKKPPPTKPKKEEVPTEPEKAPTIEDTPDEEVAVEEAVDGAGAEEEVAEEAMTEAEEPKEEDSEEDEDEEDDAEEVVEDGGELQVGEGNHEDNTPSDIAEKSEEYKIESGDIPEGEDGADDEDGGETEDEENDDADKDDDPSSYFHTPSEESRKRKEVEIFVGGLNNKATEDDLIKTFSAFGEVQSARIARNPVSKKSKGFAFIQYANVEQAKKVLAESKDGVEVRGKHVTVSASTANDTLYLGNICKTWTADQVRETLKTLGVEHNFEILLPNDPASEGNSKGFAFLEFRNHFDAMAAFQFLKSSAVCFGRDKSARVAFAHSMRHLNEDALSQVKTVYVEGLPSSWDEEKIKDLCKQYGEIERVELSRNFSRKKRKDFGFIAFTSRESAVACVEGINNGEVKEGECKVSANLAKSEKKKRLIKPSDGAEVKRVGENTDEADQSKKDNEVNSKVINDEKITPKSKDANASKQSKTDRKVTGGKQGAQGHKKMQESSEVKKRKGKKLDTDFGARPQKRQRKDRGFGNARGRTSRYGSAATGFSGHHTDLEPHAGLLPAGRRGHSPARYDRTHHDAFAGHAGAGQATQYPHSGYAPHPGYQAGYHYIGGAQYPPRRVYH